MVVATDRSVNHYRGGALVVIDDGEGGRYVSVLPVDGNLDDMDSFRVELYGILSALVVLDILVQMEGVSGTVKKIPLWTDSQASITAIQNSSQDLPWSNKAAPEKEYSLIYEIRKRLGNMPMVNLHWVEAHQQRLNTREQLLNNLADKQAKLQHLAKGAWK